MVIGIDVEVQDRHVARRIFQCSVVVEPARAADEQHQVRLRTTSRGRLTPPLVPTTPAFSGMAPASCPCR
jgi:hypothetical protein